MRSRYWTLGVLVLLIGTATTGYGAALPRNDAGDASTTTSTSAAKATPKKPAATGAHSTKTSATSAKRRAAHLAVVHAQLAPTPSRISEIQSALSREGAYQAAPTGQWDAATVDAMRQFQSGHGLVPSGKIDALTLQKLGLGSQVSGMGAPLPLAEPQASVADNGGQTQHP